MGGEEEEAAGDSGFFSSFTTRLLFVPRVLAGIATENNFRNKLALKCEERKDKANMKT